jgi:hypothetical protein
MTTFESEAKKARLLRSVRLLARPLKKPSMKQQQLTVERPLIH